MIFTLFLLCAFNVHNVCTIDGDTKSGLDACADTESQPDCYSACETACKAEPNAANAPACEGLLECFNGTTHLYIAHDKAACVASAANNANCDDICEEYCTTVENADATACLDAFPCTDSGASNANIAGEDACKAASGRTTSNASPRPECIPPCRTYCLANVNAAECEPALTCFDGANKKYRHDDSACTKSVGDGADVKCKPNCQKHCVEDADADTVACLAVFKCENVADTPLADSAACAAAGPLGATKPGCVAPCRRECLTNKAAVVSTCEGVFPCTGEDTNAKTGDDSCVAVVANASSTYTGNPYCLPRCRDNCQKTKTADVTKCNTALPCMVGDPAAAAVGDAICEAATTTTTPVHAADLDCIAQCRGHCAKDTTSDATKCLAALPCKTGSTNITGLNACKNVAGQYDPAATNANLDADIDCTAPCRTYCLTDATPDATACNTALTCKTSGSPTAGTAACTQLKGNPPTTPRNEDCTIPCLTFCTGESAVKADCEAALPCWDGTGKKTATGADACKKVAATPSVVSCTAACTAYCSTDPCSEAKKPDCKTQCDTWCTSNTDSELCETEGEGGFSVVLSLVVLLFALL